MTKSNNRLPIDTKIRLVLLKSGITWPAFYAADPECYTQSGGLTTVNGAMTAGSVAIDGGTLRGTGIINGSVTSSGTVASGTSPGMLTINGNYTQTDTGRLLIELGGYDQGINYDFLNITGDATLKGILQIAFSTGFTAATGSYFDIMKAS